MLHSTRFAAAVSLAFFALAPSGCGPDAMGGPRCGGSSVTVDAKRACELAAAGGGNVTAYSSPVCDEICGVGSSCTLPADYVQAFLAAQSSPDAGGRQDGGLETGDAGAMACPANAANVMISCSQCE